MWLFFFLLCLVACFTLQLFSFLKQFLRFCSVSFVTLLFQNLRCWSSIGYSGYDQDLSIDHGCGYKGVIIHEILHALGFFHEQSRLDRDKYVTIKWDNIEEGIYIFFFCISSKFIIFWYILHGCSKIRFKKI